MLSEQINSWAADAASANAAIVMANELSLIFSLQFQLKVTMPYHYMTTGIYIKSTMLAYGVSLDSGLYQTEKRNMQCRVGRLLMIFPPIVTKLTFQTSRKYSNMVKIDLQSSVSVYTFEGHPRSEIQVAGRIRWPEDNGQQPTDLLLAACKTFAAVQRNHGTIL